MNQIMKDCYHLHYGVATDLLTEDEVAERVVQWIEKGVEAKGAHIISKMGDDILELSFQWGFKEVATPEIIRVLRESDIVLSDKEIQYEKAQDKVLESLEARGYKVVIISSSLALGYEKKQQFLRDHPKLQVESITIHPVDTLEQLEHFDQFERHVQEELIRHKPDVIFLDLKDRELEMILMRMHYLLKKGVVMMTDRASFGKKSFLKRSLIEAPTLLREKLDRLFSFRREGRQTQTKLPPSRLLESDLYSIGIMEMPEEFCQWKLPHCMKEFAPLMDCRIQILDFQHVKKMDMEAIACLLRFVRERKKEEKIVFFVHVPKNIEKRFHWYQVYDAFSECIEKDRQTLLHRLNRLIQEESCFVGVQEVKPFCLVTFFGEIDARLDQTDIFEQLVAKMLDPYVIFDLSWCPFMDSYGLGFLLRLRKQLVQGKKQFILVGAQEGVYQTLKLAKVDKLFHIEKDMASALEFLEREECTKTHVS